MLIGSCHCGKAGWTLEGVPGSITACNCTLCRRYGTLWAYDYEGERISVTGRTASYTRVGKDKPSLEILFCPSCACVVSWRGLRLQRMGAGVWPSMCGWRRRISLPTCRSITSMGSTRLKIFLPTDDACAISGFDHEPRLSQFASTLGEGR